jgi:hypothetical protein
VIRTIRRELEAVGWLIRVATLAAIAGALYDQLRRPPEERTWHGRLLGYVPYDFRMPTLARLRNAFWNPSSGQLFTDQPFGVGWTVNIPVAIGLVQRALGTPSSAEKRTTRRRATRRSTAEKTPSS